MSLLLAVDLVGPVSVIGRHFYLPVFSPAGVLFSRQQFLAEDLRAIFDDVRIVSRNGADLVLARNVFIEIGWSRFEKPAARVPDQQHGLKLRDPHDPLRPFGLRRCRTLWPRVIPYGGLSIASARCERALISPRQAMSRQRERVVFVAARKFDWRLSA